jgi:two-component system, sensor histidine kinase YesM
VRSRSIQLSIILGFTGLIVISILIIGAISYYLYTDALKKNSLDYTTQVVAQLNRDIDNYVANMDTISIFAMNNQDLQTYVQETVDQKSLQGGNPNRTATDKQKVTALFQSIISERKDIDSIILLLDDRTIVSDQPNDVFNPYAEWPPAASLSETTSSGSAILSSSYVQDVIVGKFPWVITLRRDVLDPTTHQHRGTLLVNLDYKIIEELCNNIQLGKSGYVFIINPEGEIVYHPRQQLIYSGLKSEKIDQVKNKRNGQLTARVEGRDVLYTARTSQDTGWTVVGVSYLDELFTNRSDLEYFFAMTAIACFFATVIISYFISVRITQPIEILRQSVQSVESGNFDIDVTVDSTDEVNGLAQDFNIAIRKIKELIFQNAKTYEDKRKHELKALQAQINPHFLYNTLDSIIWMIECEENQDAITMTSSLAKFFRMGLSRGSEIVSVQDEIEHLTSYLVIQKLRYKDRLDYTIEMNPEILSSRTLKLLLQPLAENAIYHGLKTQDRIGMLKVTGEQEGNDLIFKVIDNGTGMTRQELDDLMNGRLASKGLGGVGVKNVRERIRLYFGDSYGVTYESEKGSGTTATIRLPATFEGDL